MIFGLFGSSKSTEIAVGDAANTTSGVATPPLPPQALAEAPEATPAQDSASTPSEQPCPHCGSTERWGLSPWCPRCFYYPKLDAVMVPDGEIDLYLDTNPADFNSVPMWARILGVGILVVFLATVAAAVLLPAESPIRETWTLTQVGLGLLAAAIAHFLVFCTTISQTDRYGPFDIAVHPLEVWGPAVQNLPDKAWRLWQSVWGLTAALWAVTLIGGVQYSAIFDMFGAETKERTNVSPRLLPASKTNKKEVNSFEAARRKYHPTSKGLEHPSKIEAIKTEPAARRQADCFIVGYVKSSSGGFSSVLLGSYIGGRLTYVGSLSAAEIPDDARATLRERLPRLEQSKPVLRTSHSATWLKPVVSCRVGYKDLTASKTLNEPKFTELLEDAADGQ